MTESALSQHSAPRLAPSETAAWLFCALGLAMVVALVALRSNELAAAPVAVMGTGAAIAAATGRARNKPQVGYPWTLFSLACVGFIVGAVLRQALDGTPLAAAADVATLSGYGATLAAFIGLLRSRQASHNVVHHELVDGAIVLVAVTSAALVAFTVPTAVDGGVSVAGLVQGVYPVVDSAMIFVAILLSWTSARRVTSFWLLGLSVVFILVGDIGYAWIGRHGETVGSPLLDLPFVVAFTLFGAAALHPSMRALSSVQQRPVPAWSRGRLGLLAPMLVVPAAVAIFDPDADGRWVGALAGVAVTLLLLVRAVTAVQSDAKAQEGLRYQATHDQLTRLANRPQLIQAVDDLLARAAVEGDRVDVLFLDIDSFKLVNDTWGHQVGDRVLRLAAQRLLAVTRAEDVVARIGGDEFVVARYVGERSADTGEKLAAEIVDAFRNPLPGEDSLVTTVSIGLAGSGQVPGAGPTSAESLLRDADTAMYRAKSAGRNRALVFDPSMHDKVRQRVETELALRYALDRHELLLHYQPVVAVDTGEVVGAEALLRWAHPGLGMVSPLEFIPIAEETGLIVEIGEWVVSEALRQAARWREQRAAIGLPDLWISVNVSARQLRDPSLVDHVDAELRRHGVPAELLVLEITESAMMADQDVAASLLHELRALGLSLAVDDFGTGYSSLGHLRRFPVSKVKIDRAFVSGIEHDADDAEIVRAVVAMSLAMHLDVVAEGVETAGQRELLEQLGVQLGQGWHFGRPMPAEDCAFVQPQTAGASAGTRAKS